MPHETGEIVASQTGWSLGIWSMSADYPERLKTGLQQSAKTEHNNDTRFLQYWLCFTLYWLLLFTLFLILFILLLFLAECFCNAFFCYYLSFEMFYTPANVVD